MTRESTIERGTCAHARKTGWWPIKLAPTNEIGLPDRMFLKDGRVVFVEFKPPGQKPRAIQMKRISDLRLAGFEVHVIDDLDEGKALF